IMLALAAPAIALRLTGGDNRGVPLTTEATRGLHVLETTLGPGALAPHQIVVDTHRRGGEAATRAAQERLVAELRRDPAVIARTARSRGSSWRCWPSPTCCCCGRSGRSCCPSRP